MSTIGKYHSLTRNVLNHPLEFCSSMAQLNLKLGTQQLEILSWIYGLGNKELEALAHTNKPDLLVANRKKIYEDIQAITKASAENVMEALYETVDIMDHLADEKRSRPRSRTTRSPNAAKAPSQQKVA